MDGWLVGWLEFNVPFQHKYGNIRDEAAWIDLLFWHLLCILLYAGNCKKPSPNRSFVNTRRVIESD